MRANNSLIKVGKWLFELAWGGAVVTGMLSVVGLLALIGFGMQLLGMGSHGTNIDMTTVASLMFIASVVSQFFAFIQLRKIGKLLMGGEFLTDSMASYWWRFSHGITLGGVILLLSPEKIANCNKTGITKYEFAPLHIEHIYYFAITAMCCYVIAFILREAAKTKHEAVEAKKENEGFV